MTDSIGNIPLLSVDKTVEILSNMYSNYIKKGVSFKDIPSTFLWSSPGLGKSQGVRQIAKEVSDLTGKKTVVTDVRLLLFNPVDIRGIPTSNADKTLAVWLKPKIFDMDPSDEIVNFLFLDELSAAPVSVQASAYQLVLDRVVGEHKLPDNCIVICAGNRTTDKSVAYAQPKALSNRLLHIEVDASFESWNRWAIENGIHPMILGFLKFKRDYLNTFNAKDTSLAFCTPRSWQMASSILNNVSSDLNVVYELISGVLGKGVAVELKTWSKVFNELPNVEDIFNGENVAVPAKPDVIFALTSSMVAYARAHKDDMQRIANSIKFADKLPPDFSLVLMKDYMYIEKNYKLKLLHVPEFSEWLRKKGKLLDEANGIRG